MLTNVGIVNDYIVLRTSIFYLDTHKCSQLTQLVALQVYELYSLHLLKTDVQTRRSYDYYVSVIVKRVGGPDKDGGNLLKDCSMKMRTNPVFIKIGGLWCRRC